MRRRSGDGGLGTAPPGTSAVASEVRAGLRVLFDAEYEPMYRLAFTMVGTDGDAEEIVQDAFVALAKRWAEVDNPGGYLRVSVVNGARKRLRSATRLAGAEASLRALSAVREPLAEEYLLDIIDALPERQRTALVLTYYAGMTSAEVGEVLECPAATARSLVHRALDRLRQEVTR